MTVLISGSGGFVGSHIFDALEGEKVGIVRDTGKREVKGTVAVGDLRDSKFVDRVVLEYNPDVVIHVAACAIIGIGLANPYEMYSSNVMATLNLLEACKKTLNKDLHFLYFSTDKVLGDVARGRETQPYPWQNLGPYEQSKAMAEVLSLRYSGQFNVAVTRCGNIFGPGDINDRLIPNDIRRALKGENPLAYNEDKRMYVYVEDAVRAVKLLLEKKATGIWHIGTDEVKTTVEVAQEIVDAFGNPSLRVEKAVDRKAEAHKYLYYIHNQFLDWSKLCGLGWEPQVSFKQGIRNTVEWWKEMNGR